MEEILQQILACGLVVVWLGVAFALNDRLRARWVEYMRRFPPVEGVRPDTFISGNPFGPVARAISRMARGPQDDPDLERLRRARRRSSRQLALWIFGFPLLALGVVALLILSGWVHPQ